jgi:RHS repeat-associated protein
MDYPTTPVVKHIYGYDELDRLTGVTISKGANNWSFSYTPGASGNRTAAAENLNGTTRNVTYGYDNLYRLTNEVITGASPTGTIGYDGQPGYANDPTTETGLDRVGNRHSRAVTPNSDLAAVVPAATYSYDSRDRLNSEGNSYDDNGNTTGSAGFTYGYDFENHLISRTGGGGPNITITYGGDGNRISKNVGGTLTYYLVDDQNPTGYPQVLQELNAIGQSRAVTKRYTYGISIVSQSTINSPPSTDYYGHDGHGNTRVLFKGDGTVQAYSYDAFGILVSPSTPPPDTDYLYCGEQFDRSLSLYYLRARYLNVAAGRFFTIDTSQGRNEDPLTFHKYLYCKASPLNGIDPTGLETVLVIRDDGYAYASKPAAESAASHLQRAGWNVVYLAPGDLVNYAQQYDGIITSGHGDANMSVTLYADVVQDSLRRTGSRLQVAIFLSCHSTEFAAPFLSNTFSTDNALFITYSGYGYGIAPRRWRVGRMIDDWIANPRRAEYDLYNPGADFVGKLAFDYFLRPVGKGLGKIWDFGSSIVHDIGGWF